MPSMQEFQVIKPPTSREVQADVVKALRTNGLLTVTLLGDQQVPRPVPMDITFRIAQTIHPEDGHMRIAGSDESGNSVTVRTQDEQEPASATLIKTLD